MPDDEIPFGGETIDGTVVCVNPETCQPKLDTNPASQHVGEPLPEGHPNKHRAEHHATRGTMFDPASRYANEGQ